VTRHLRRLGLALCAGGLLACASTSAPPPAAESGDPAPTAAQVGPNIDPFQGFNRTMFWVNDQFLDRFFYGPLAHGWMYISGETVRTHMEQFFDNLNFPGYFVQPLLQGDPHQSAVALTRFLVNSSIGVAGIFDPADAHFGLKRRREDMGQTFGVWGIPPGPFLVLPLVEPATTVRDFAGWPIDQILNVGDTYFWSWFAPFGETIVRDVNRRALYDDQLTSLREASLDFYAGARDAYLKRREIAIRNGADLGTEEPSDGLYDIDEDSTKP
jgi:phospholipid-binding lipoprotein MlaA